MKRLVDREFSPLSVLGYSIAPGVVLPDMIRKEKESIILSTNDNIYKTERNWLLTMLHAAEQIYYSDSRDEALCDVVNTALSIRDYNIAIIAADKIYYSDTKDKTLVKIITVASGNRDGFGYAVLAADKIYYSDTKTKGLKIIIDAAKREATDNVKKQ